MAEDLNSLLQKFNELDMDPASTENFILGLEQAKSGVKSYTKKEAEEFNLGTLTKKDIEELRAAREAEVALKRGLITASQAKTSKKIKQISKVGKLHSGLDNLIKKQKQELTDLEKLKQEFQPQAKVIKKNAKKTVLPNSSKLTICWFVNFDFSYVIYIFMFYSSLIFFDYNIFFTKLQYILLNYIIKYA